MTNRFAEGRDLDGAITVRDRDGRRHHISPPQFTKPLFTAAPMAVPFTQYPEIDDPAMHAEMELELIFGEQRRRLHRMDPALWANDKLGDYLWSKQREICESVLINRRTAVKSCHESGKSFTAADLVAWWLDIHEPGTAFVVTSAPTGHQVKAILWREIGRAFARGHLRGRVNMTEWYMFGPDGNEELVAFGRKPDDLQPTAFSGIHAEHVLVILDEACGMVKALVDAADTLIANESGRMLMIGNPDYSKTEFFEACKPGSGYNVITISAFDTPNLTGEEIPDKLRPVLISRLWVEEKRKKWARDWRWNEEGTRVLPPPGHHAKDTHPMWASKILGEFPVDADSRSLIPLTWIEAAKARTLIPTLPNELGVDCGAGGDASTTAQRQGYVVRVISEDHNPNTMETCGKVVDERRRTGATRVKIDRIGIGAGIVDRGKELGEPFVGVNVGEAPNCFCVRLANDFINKGIVAIKRAGSAHYDDCPRTRFVNLRAENWWGVRDLFEVGTIDIDEADEDLAAELSSLQFKFNSKGQIQIESKEDAKRRGIASPNKADAVMHALSDTPEQEQMATAEIF